VLVVGGWRGRDPVAIRSDRDVDHDRAPLTIDDVQLERALALFERTIRETEET